MTVLIKEVQSQEDLQQFVRLPFEIYKNNKYWVPPVIKDEIKSLKKEENPAYEFCDAKFWIAYKNGVCVGRIGAIINKEYNEKTGNPVGRFSRMEFIDDTVVSEKLFETAEKWLRSEGMKSVQGPLGFSNLDLQGLLVEGFEEMPSIASVYHQPYYRPHIEALGYSKEIDWVEFRLTINEIPEKAQKLVNIIQKRYGLKVLSFKKARDLKPYGEKIFEVLNKAFDELFAVVSFNDKMIQFYVKKYFSILNPEFVKIIKDKDDQLVGFIVALPSLSKAMQKANGKLFPFGFYHIMKALKNPTEVDLLLTGVDPKLQGQGLSALLINELQKTMIEKGVKHVETTGIFETNHKVIQHWKNYEHVQHKRRRCFKKDF